eukprot:scaffold6388_cov62-Cylindrotheca_fusiformis.AAC.3
MMASEKRETIQKKDTTTSSTKTSGGGDDETNNNKNKKKRPAATTTSDDNAAATATNGAVTPITSEGNMPQKKFYRQRAHCNPLAHNDTFEYPRTPQLMDWSTEQHYPNIPPGNSLQPTVLDIGCGF